MHRKTRIWVVTGLLLTILLTGVLVWRMPEVAVWRWYLTDGKPAMSPMPVSLAPNLRWFDDYYVVADLGENAYAIGEPRYGQCNFSYLIVGTQKALLFDTGPGIRDIRRVVQSLTALPVEALPSHLHFDHVGNLDKFDDVALPDLAPLRRQIHAARFTLGFYQYLGFVEGFRRPSFAVRRWIKPQSGIDLGNRTLTLLSVPGHTADSVVLMDASANRLFAGDFIYPSSIYAFLPGANLADYAASAARVAQRLDARSTIYTAHGCDGLPKVEVPILARSDVVALGTALNTANESTWPSGPGWYPRRLAVNEHMTLLAKYPWMRP